MTNIHNVLLFCGAFDPITTGHMLMLNLCIKSTFFNEIRILPSGKRVDKAYKTTDEHRKKMCEIAMKVFKEENQNLNISLCEYEMKLVLAVDSYFTVSHFNNQEPDKKFYFFMGSDILPQMFDWPYSKELIDITNFLIATREGHGIAQSDLNRLKSYVLLDKLLEDAGVSKETSKASSTEARTELGQGSTCASYLLHPDVMKYVQDHNLYRQPGVVSSIYP